MPRHSLALSWLVVLAALSSPGCIHKPTCLFYLCAQLCLPLFTETASCQRQPITPSDGSALLMLRQRGVQSENPRHPGVGVQMWDLEYRRQDPCGFFNGFACGLLSGGSGSFQALFGDGYSWVDNTDYVVIA
ncbi:hypothetical protein NDU88_003588 [Pleurodeles waltl]|uniref:Secreted protein n=1 Tax=Pleurodeles waltl TaxID=8319 RepID=A0AAV7T539_PLEWA|nr:hypothetical protein NDU88_003588 [Pleurodeles waltl]